MKTIRSVLFALAFAIPTWPTTSNAAPPFNQAELIALLKSNKPNSEKVKAFKPLTVFGNKDAVPAIAPYLADPELSSWARLALEDIPDPACDEAFREAEPKLKGRLLIGVINSMGVRRDAKAVEALTKRLGDANENVAAAAASSLGRIGGDKAMQALENALASTPPAVRFEVADGLVRCAEKDLAEGKKENAIRLYDLVAKADVPERRVLEAVRGAIIARGAEGLPMLTDLLKSSDKKRFALGLKMTREIADPVVTDVLLDVLAHDSTAHQILLVQALADRADHKARDALIQAAKSGDIELRIAAIGGLKKIGDASCGPVLLDASLDTNADVSQAAAEVLADLPAKEFDELLANRLGSSTGPSRLVLIGMVGRRHVESTTPTLFKLANDDDRNVRMAAISALGETARVDELPALMSRTNSPNKEEAKSAETALRAAFGRLSDRAASTAQLQAALATANVPTKCKLIDLLVAIGGDKALKIVADAANDSDADIRAAGYKALGEWTSVEAGPVLHNLVLHGDQELKIGAMRAYIRIARQFVIPNDERMSMFLEIMAIAERDQERRLALDVLKQIHTPESLALAVSYLGKPEMMEAAANVAVTVSEKIVAKHPREVGDAMTKVMHTAKNKDVLNKARALANRAGKK